MIGGRDLYALDNGGCGRARSYGGAGGGPSPGLSSVPAAQANRALGGGEAQPLDQLRLLVGAQEEVDRREPAPEAGPVALAHGAAGEDHAERRVRGLERGQRALAADHLCLGRLADALMVRGCSVEEIESLTRTRPHAITPWA